MILQLLRFSRGGFMGTPSIRPRSPRACTLCTAHTNADDRTQNETGSEQALRSNACDHGHGTVHEPRRRRAPSSHRDHPGARLPACRKHAERKGSHNGSLSWPCRARQARGSGCGMTTPELMTAEDVAAMLGINVKTVYAGAAAGEIPARRVGRRFLFVRSVIEDWLTTAPEGPPPSRRAAHTRKPSKRRGEATSTIARGSLAASSGQHAPSGRPNPT